MQRQSAIKLVEYDDEKFRGLKSVDKLLLLEEAQQTNYENSMALQRQLARIYALQHKVNEKRIEELEQAGRRDREEPPIQITCVLDKKKDRKRKEEEARQRAREAGLGVTPIKRQKFNK